MQRHDVVKVYINDVHDMDLLMIGQVTSYSIDGAQQTRGFVSRIKIQDVNLEPKVQQYRVLARCG